MNGDAVKSLHLMYSCMYMFGFWKLFLGENQVHTVIIEVKMHVFDLLKLSLRQQDEFRMF